jgi:sugar lactone lactonase YvrE
VLGTSGKCQVSDDGKHLLAPTGLCTDAAGNVYVSAGAMGKLAAKEPSFERITGGPERDWCDWGGQAARWSYSSNPAGCSFANGKLYVTSTKCGTVRSVSPGDTPEGIATILVGDNGTDKGPVGGAGLRNPQDVAAADDGTAYVADTGHHVVRVVAANGTVSTLVGIEGKAGNFTSSSISGVAAKEWLLDSPAAVALDSNRSCLYIADRTSIIRVDLKNRSRSVEVVVGLAGDASGPAGEGVLANSTAVGQVAGLALDPAGNLYYSEWAAGLVRRVDRAGYVATVAGVVEAAGGGGSAVGASGGRNGSSGVQLATAVELLQPGKLAVWGGEGGAALYIAEHGSCVVRKVAPLMP